MSPRIVDGHRSVCTSSSTDLNRGASDAGGGIAGHARITVVQSEADASFQNDTAAVAGIREAIARPFTVLS